MLERLRFDLDHRLHRLCERSEAIQSSGTSPGVADPWIAALRSQGREKRHDPSSPETALAARVRGHVRAFARTRDGVSAVEFSLIAPILLVMFMAAIELPRAFMIGRRLDIAAAAMADLISRDTYADLSPVYAAMSAISNPYNVDAAAIVLTAAGTYQNGAARTTQVCSSATLRGQARQVGSSLGAPPAGMTAGGDRFVVSDITMPYRPVFGVFPSLLTFTFHFQKIWPVRGGETYKGQKEIVLPNGKPCPA